MVSIVTVTTSGRCRVALDNVSRRASYGGRSSINTHGLWYGRVMMGDVSVSSLPQLAGRYSSSPRWLSTTTDMRRLSLGWWATTYPSSTSIVYRARGDGARTV